MNLQEHIRKVLKEETEHLSKQDNIKKMVQIFGWKSVAQMLGGFENLYNIGFNDEYNEFLNLYSNLEVVKCDEEPDWILFRLNESDNVMVYDTNNGYVYINDEIIWLFFSKGIGFNFNKIRTIMKKWLENTYNLKGVTPTDMFCPSNLSCRMKTII